MKYDLGSDLHVDINARIGMVNFKDQQKSDTIVLAGDLANTLELTAQVLALAATVYKNVIFVDGNHEHYCGKQDNATIFDNMDYLREAAKVIPNVSYLTGTNRVIIDDVMFAGVNAWYDFKLAPSQYSIARVKETWLNYLNDARLSIFDHPPEELAEMQTDDLAKTVAEAQDDQMVEKIVIVTHTASSPKGLLVKNEPIWDMLNGSFGCSAMSKVFAEDVNRKIVHAVFGHTHYTYDFHDFDGIRFVCNPRGYHGAPGELGDRWRLIQMDTEDGRP